MPPPPFATELPDSAYEDLPKPISRPRREREDDQTAPGGARESAYTAFDSYFTGNDGHDADHRVSGVGNIGRGLMIVDSDSESDDEQPGPRTTAQPTNKHRALYQAATGASDSQSSFGRAAAQSTPKHAQSQEPGHLRVMKQPQAVELAGGNDWPISQHVEPSAPPGIAAGRSLSIERRGPPTPIPALQLPLASPAPAHIRPIQPAFMQGPTSPNSFLVTVPGPPTPRTPQPLPPPQTPITPVFARPGKETAVKFDDNMPILRGNSEETLLPRGAGGKGDEFWRRFSMVAHEGEKMGSSKSAWLRKTENGTTRLATWVWCVGILLLLAIGGAAGLGWYFTHNKPAKQPVAIGGSAGEKDISDSTSSLASSHQGTTATSVRPTKVTAALLPTDTSTNNKRYVDELVPRNTVQWDSVPHAHRRPFINRMLH